MKLISKGMNMSKILKLTNLLTYTSSATQSIVMKKGESARFSDKHAALMLLSTRTNGENEQIPYWVEQPEGSKCDYEFVVDEGKAVVDDEEVHAPASKAAKAATQRTRATRAVA